MHLLAGIPKQQLSALDLRVLLVVLELQQVQQEQ
jgi:hypothetical protein